MSIPVFVFYLSLCFSYLIIRPFSTFVHELGHLCFLKAIGQTEDIKVFLGSVGEGKRAFRIRTGGILWVIHPVGVLMRGSITDFKQPLRCAQIIPFALSGPLFSLLMATTSGILAFGDWLADAPWVKPFLIMSALIPAADFLLAMFYTYSPILHSSEVIFGNDGQLILWRLRFGRQTEHYLHGWWLFEKERYAEAVECFQKVFQSGNRDKELMEHLIFGGLMLRQFENVMNWDAEMAKKHPRDGFDACRLASALLASGDEKGAKAALNEALINAPGHHEALNFRAFLAIEGGNWEIAAQDLHRAIRSNREFAVAHCNLGWLHLLQNNPLKAHASLSVATKLEYENPALHRNWALYHCLLHNATEAAAALERAKLLGINSVDYFHCLEKIRADVQT